MLYVVSFPPSLTMMHLCITQCTYWTPLLTFKTVSAYQYAQCPLPRQRSCFPSRAGPWRRWMSSNRLHLNLEKTRFIWHFESN